MVNQADTPAPEAVRSLASDLGRELDPAQARGLAVYLGELFKWNRKMNLVGAGGWRRAMAELVADSWRLADFLNKLDLPAEPLSLDIGAGAGLPGVPLRLFWRAGEYVMVEPRQKRAAFLNFILSRLDLPETRVVNSRAEDLGPEFKNADLVLGRAVRPWPEFLRMCGGLLAPGGRCVVFAGAPAPGGDVPPGFSLGPTASYEAAGKKRYFWSFSSVTPDSISM